MKEIDIHENIRRAASLNKKIDQGIIVPGQKQESKNWPMCMVCLKGVDAAKVEDAGPKGCEVRAWCHGAEEAVKVRWELHNHDSKEDVLSDRNVGWAINRALRDTVFFDPKQSFDFSSKR